MNEADRKIILANASKIYGKTSMGRRRPNAPKLRPKWPMESYSLGGKPGDKKKLAKLLKKKGVPTEISRDGNPICTSQAHQNAVAKVLGFFNKDNYS